jgi:hypothetical protein
VQGWLWWSVKIHHSSFNLLHSLGEGGFGGSPQMVFEYS